MKLERVTLTGRFVDLVPLEREHADALSAIGLDADLWSATTINVGTREEMQRYVEEALSMEAAGAALPFVIRLRSSGEIAGTTRFYSYVEKHRRIEIGFTWVARAWQRTAVNSESKLLLLGHAFERLGCLRVSFSAAAGNERSRAALLRIGATEEGLLRNYMISARNGPSDVRVFSIVAAEWPGVRAGLRDRLGLD